MDRRRLLLRLLSSALLLPAAPVLGWGPGVHLRECARVAERMIAEQHPLASAVGPSDAAWLRLGCIAPDLRQAVPELEGTPTHAPTFATFLLAAAQQPGAPAGAVAFAIGAMAHQASDGAESVFAAVATAKALLGAPDVLPGVEDGLRAECELMTEILGEFPNGRSDLLMALLKDLGVFTPAGTAPPLAWQGVLGWYHDQLLKFGAKPKGDKAQTLASLQALLAKAGAKAGPLGADTVQTMLTLMKDRTGAENLALLAALPIGDALAAVGMSGIDGAAALDPAHFRHHARLPYFADAAFLPDVYAPLAELGPHWTLRRIAGHHVEADFPGWNGWLMAAGIRLSLAHGMPADLLLGQTEVLFDKVEWRALPDGTGGALGPQIAAWKGGDGPVRLRVRLFGSAAASYRVVLQVRRAPPGFALDLGEPVTETSAVIAFDPMQAEDVPRPWIEVDVDPSAAAGKTFALYAVLARGAPDAPAAAAKAIALGRLEPYAAHGALDVHSAPYLPWQQTLPKGAGSSAVMPALALPQLPPEHPSQQVGSLLLRIVDAPAGNLLSGIRAKVYQDGKAVATLPQSAPGRVLLEGFAPGSYLVALEPTAADAALALPAALTPSAISTPDGTLGRGVVVVGGGRDVLDLPVLVAPVPLTAALDLQAKAPQLTATLAPLEPFGDQDKQVAFRLTDVDGVVLTSWPLQNLRQKDATSEANPVPAAQLAYALPIDAEALQQAWVAAGHAEEPPPSLVLQARLCFAAKKATTPPAAESFSPWRAVEVALVEVPIDPDASGGADAGSDAAADAEVDVPADDAAQIDGAAPVDVAVDAATQDATASAPRKSAGGCSAQPNGSNPGPAGALWAAALAGLWGWRRRREAR